jgi:hypothetical protein
MKQLRNYKMGAFLLNVLKLFGTKRVLWWGLDQAVKSTDTLLDDHGLDFVKNAVEGDLDAALLAAEKAIAILTEKKQSTVSARGGVVEVPPPPKP